MMKRFMSRQGVQRVVGDQCQYGLQSTDGKGTALARKRIGFLTNAVCVAQRLSRRCPNRPGYQVHRHVVLDNGRPKAAQVYPDKLCKEICLGIQEQVQKDREGQFLSANIVTDGNECSKKLMKVANELKERRQTVEEEEGLMEEAWDDVSGDALDPNEVKKARKVETECVNKLQLYSKVFAKEAYEYTGKAPISVRRIDINTCDVPIRAGMFHPIMLT